MDVCIISRVFPPGVGGAETYAYELANTIGNLGHTVEVYTQWIDEPNEIVDVHDNVEVYRIAKAHRKLAGFSTLYFSYKARQLIDFSKYDIIHGMLMPASTIAVSPFNSINTPLVLTSHGTSLDEATSVALETPADYLLRFFFHPLNVVMDRIAGHYADAIIAISDHAYDQLTNVYGFEKEKVHMIPHGVDIDRFSPCSERHPAVNKEKTTVLYVGRLGARKGVGLALRAIAHNDNPDIELLIAGTGRHENRLRRLSERLKIANQIRFLGYVSDAELPLLYSSADVFILPSRYEGFGLVLLEAMACGTPVIGTNVGGIPTAIDEGNTGLLVQRDPSEVSNAIDEITGDTNRLEVMSQNALTRAQEMSWTSIVESVEQVYESLLSGEEMSISAGWSFQEDLLKKLRYK